MRDVSLNAGKKPHSGLADGYDDEGLLANLLMPTHARTHTHTPLSAREMEGGDPFRSLMSWARVGGTAALQSDMLEL